MRINHKAKSTEEWSNGQRKKEASTETRALIRMPGEPANPPSYICLFGHPLERASHAHKRHPAQPHGGSSGANSFITEKFKYFGRGCRYSPALQVPNCVIGCLKAMPLIDYSSSSDDEPRSTSNPPELPAARQPSTPTLPPLPSNFHDLYAFAARPSVQDDPELHGGRQRSTPHVEGQWPTHVYLGCMSLFLFPVQCSSRLSKQDSIDADARRDAIAG